MAETELRIPARIRFLKRPCRKVPSPGWGCRKRSSLAKQVDQWAPSPARGAEAGTRSVPMDGPPPERAELCEALDGSGWGERPKAAQETMRRWILRGLRPLSPSKPPPSRGEASNRERRSSQQPGGDANGEARRLPLPPRTLHATPAAIPQGRLASEEGRRFRHRALRYLPGRARTR